MFGKHSTLKHVAQGIVVAAVVVAVAVPSALAGTKSGDRTRGQACQGDAIWITVTDDLGLSQLVPVSHGPCTAAVACAPSADAGWITVIDDLGLPSLVQTHTETAAPCVLDQSSPPAPAVKITKSKTTKPKITKSKYRGWVLVTDTTGSAKLVSRSDIRSS
jgi:hypothetical protein